MQRLVKIVDSRRGGGKHWFDWGGGKKTAATIGDNVFIGTGAKIIGDIAIADDCVIGANSVVVKSITEKGITVAGVPAKKVSSNNSAPYIDSRLDH